jgi:hypothetical protein
MMQKAASHFDIQMKETDWHQFGAHRAIGGSIGPAE